MINHSSIIKMRRLLCAAFDISAIKNFDNNVNTTVVASDNHLNIRQNGLDQRAIIC